ncbi:MAG TPA: hypothetical protein PKX79_11535 [Spirochaetota bacterium]|jgi:hypothetical protein|nr:hypothetical protein [Spirochaetota bacterium]OQA98262.1 MAG: hypothetical protein BWY23_01195 [Spirochaetes bacterium ADurb.Bin218]HOK03162.1 hypothetical protein [Spirochaetota bacterium]HOK93392.1 hypothetical protein [Spirochaetota bacterium]HOV08335.1 hypothetical protein [Spirochaetota bacterium]
MKVVHVLKRIETIDNDIKELRKLEKSIAKDKSFTTPIYITIEKQINILLSERIKLLELKIANPPENLLSDEEIEREKEPEPLPINTEKKKNKKAKPLNKTSEEERSATSKTKEIPVSRPKREIIVPDDEDDIPMLTQDEIDAKFENLKGDAKTNAQRDIELKEENLAEDSDDTHVKLLDIALEKGTLSKKTIEKEKKVRFFRENFPSD